MARWRVEAEEDFHSAVGRVVNPSLDERMSAKELARGIDIGVRQTPRGSLNQQRPDSRSPLSDVDCGLEFLSALAGFPARVPWLTEALEAPT